jgi:ubiquinone/menaquinone biosynthesis C-methylase UbiE
MESVKEYYGKILNKTSDLKTNACCTLVKYPKYITDALSNIHHDVLSSYYGCGLVMPSCLHGQTMLDLGCGTGRDVYLLSQFVGEEGSVIGVDMTDEQLDVARQYIEYHREKNGYNSTNTYFYKGYIENLNDLEIEQKYVDIIVSNCVVNLSPDKESVFKQTFNLLKEGGEFYFSDVYSSRRIPEHLREDDVLWGECLSGALYWNDFLNLAKKCGFTDPRLVTSKPITVNNRELQEKLGDIEFYSATYRLFKLSDLESDCEDYGHTVTYLGTISQHETQWYLDEHHCFKKGEEVKVCGNTLKMIINTRFVEHFTFSGTFENHLGIFQDCGKKIPFNSCDTNSCGTNSCC